MKLLLASQGFLTKEIANEVQAVVGKNLNEINIAIVNESYLELDRDKDKRWVIKELTYLEKYIGGRIDFVNFRTHSKEEIRTRLMNADLTYIVGGKQHIYSKLFHETNTVDLIQEVAEKRVLMGTSAGSIVLGKQITSPRFWAERYNTKVENFEYQELELVPFNIVPHFLRKDHEKWTLEFLKDVLADNPFTVYAITDNQAVAYIDGKISFIGGNPEILGQN